MPFPTSIIEMAFDDGPYVLNPTWTDITSYVRSWSSSRGRSDDYSSISGSATIVLSNQDRRFDPFNTAGPYYGKLLPRRQVRIRATYGATTYAVFRGFTNGFSPNYTDAGKDSTVTIDCFDALQLLASQQLPADWADSYIKSLSPVHYLPLTEPIIQYQSNSASDFGSRPYVMSLTSAAYNEGQLAVGLTDSSIGGDSDAFGVAGIQQMDNTLLTFGDFSFTVWCKANGSSFNLYMEGVNGSNVTVNISNYGTTTAKLVVDVTQSAGDWLCNSSIQGIDFSEPFHLGFVWNNSAKTFAMYINGINRTGTIQALGAPFLWFSSVWYATLGVGTYQQLSTFSSQLTATQVQNIVKLSSAAFEETTSARVSRIIGQTQFNTALVSTPGFPAGACRDITDNAPVVTNELEIVADTECGPLFVSRDGILTMLQRDALSNYLAFPQYFTSQATFGTGGQKLDPAITLTYDGDSVRNQVVTSMSGGATYTANKSASQSSVGVASMTISTQASTYATARFIAERIAGIGQNPRLSISPFKAVIDPSGDWSTVLARDLFHRVTIAITMPSGSNVSEDVLIRNITHDVTPAQWITTIDGSGRLAGYFRADYSYADGQDIVLYAE